MDTYKGQYRNGSFRLLSWNYGRNAAYFITICTYDREHFFGEIENGDMQLSELGKIVNQEWIKSFEMRPDMNLTMDEYIVMPNHFHAIIIIGKNEYNDCRNAMQGGNTMHGGNAMHCVPTIKKTDEIKNELGPQSKNLASIIRGFKSSVTTYARINGMPDFKWQTRFYDHIIRNEKSFDRIQNYIMNNPLKWKADRFY